jgi:hypothetical protein
MKRSADARLIDKSLAASFHASTGDKGRAAKASTAIPEPFAYNACLLLLAAGASPTESKIRAEAKKLSQAQGRFYAEQHERQSERAA